MGPFNLPGVMISCSWQAPTNLLGFLAPGKYPWLHAGFLVVDYCIFRAVFLMFALKPNIAEV